MQTRKKDLSSSSQTRKKNQSCLLNKPIHKVLKDYNSCYHQRLASRKDIQFGKTNFTISINMKEYPKTLQAYNNRDFLTKIHQQQALAHEKNSELSENSHTRSKKVRCEGLCGKVFMRSYLKTLSFEGQSKFMCPLCIEEIRV